ncbi:UDP-glycosyltransferase 91A1 [Camellia lanceoleosa]|nr:UDP-glycosyltransferase 91A1 [Camellia lanceoleosa]
MESMPKPSMESDDKLHIVMLPWLAFGHMIPFLELSKLIARKGHTVSFVSTPRNIDRLPKLPPNLAPLINLVKLQLPQVDKLPENAESTTDLPYDMVKYLKMAYDQLQQPMTQLLADMAPDWVIYDFAPYWLGPVAAKLGISSVFFSIFIAASLCFLGPIPVLKGEDDRTTPEDFTVTPKWIPFKSNIACFRLFEIKRIFDDIASVDDENISGTYRLGAGIEACDVLAVRSSYEFEPEWLKLLQQIHQKPIIPIGLLPTTAYDSSDNGEAWTEIKEWLDKQSKRSVVYVAFGSEAKPSQAELTEIAFGLELSELPFFWVLRNRLGVADTEVIKLPNGFEERTKERGVVCTSWAPQLKILSHDSVGGFLSHSGLSSVIEAIQFKKPLILLSSLADTGLIARLLEEKRMAYLIPREEQDGSFTRDSVADSLRLVIVEDEGRIYKEKVKEMSGLLVDEAVEDKYVNNFLDYLKKHKQ